MTFENFTENTDLVLMHDNETLYKMLVKIVGLESPSIDHINKLIAQIVSSITACSRYPGINAENQLLM